jgi:tryptophan synthase alpha chain
MIPLERRLKTLISEGRKILSVYVTAGLPSRAALPALINDFASAGADIIELGVPFSDPLADGPVIQQGHERAIRDGVTPSVVLDLVGEIRKSTAIPIILMGYANSFLSYGPSGFESYLGDAASAGVAGMIVPDLPPEEGTAYREAAAAADLATIFLVAPTTPDHRIASIAAVSTGFVYCVSRLGVTGARAAVDPETLAFIERARRSVSDRPLLAGFGVADPATARSISSKADGIIIGSAIVSKLLDGDGPGARSAAKLVAEIRKSLDSAQE